MEKKQKSRQKKREVALYQREQTQTWKDDKISKFAKEQVQDITDCTKNVLDAELKAVRSSNLRNIWAREARLKQEEQMRLREDSYLRLKAQEREDEK